MFGGSRGSVGHVTSCNVAAIMSRCKFPLEWNNFDGKVFSFGKIFTTSCRWWRLWTFISWPCARRLAVPGGWLFQMAGCSRWRAVTEWNIIIIFGHCMSQELIYSAIIEPRDHLDSLCNAGFKQVTLNVGLSVGPQQRRPAGRGGLREACDRGGAAFSHPRFTRRRMTSVFCWCSSFNLAIWNFHSWEAIT